jgi:rubrerythrin
MKKIKESIDSEIIQIVHRAIQSEFEAISTYSSMLTMDITDDFRKILNSVIEEEKVHVAEFTKVLLDIGEEVNYFNQGFAEADDILDQGLSEGVTSTIKQMGKTVLNTIDDITRPSEDEYKDIGNKAPDKKWGDKVFKESIKQFGDWIVSSDNEDAYGVIQISYRDKSGEDFELGYNYKKDVFYVSDTSGETNQTYGDADEAMKGFENWFKVSVPSNVDQYWMKLVKDKDY